MSAIYHEFERQLASWQAQFADRPAREFVHLYLLALEREENVVVAYSARVLGPRLAALPVSAETRALFGDALHRIWIDERMHTVFVRRALLALGSPLLSVRTLFQQTAGAVGGWTVAVRQHRRWAEAPVVRAAATLVLRAGQLAGRVPRTVVAHLDYCSFRDFCRYNVHTEGTAWLCWRRLTELATRVPALSGSHLDAFARIAADEARHRHVFGILADALGADDRVRPGVSVADLTARLNRPVPANATVDVGSKTDRSAPQPSWH